MRIRFLTSIFFVLILIPISYFFLKNYFSFELNRYEILKLKYNSIKIDSHNVLIIPDEEDLKKINNEVIKKKKLAIQNFPLLLKFNKCHLKKIYPILQYSYNQSMRLEIVPETDQLFTNAVFTNDNYNFEGFLINKLNIPCIENLYYIKNIKPQIDNYKIFRKKISFKSQNTELSQLTKELFNSNDFSFIHEDLKINKTKYILKSFIKKKSNKNNNDHMVGFNLNHTLNNPGTYSKYYLNRTLEGYIIDDLLFLSKDQSNIKYIEISCNILANQIVILLFNKDNNLIYDHDFCSDRQKIILDVENYPRFDILISSYLQDFTSKEIHMELEINYFF